MARTPGLIRRGTIYYSRIVVPKDLVASFGRSQIWESLQTADRARAEVLHLQKAAHWKAAFVEAQQSMAAAEAAGDERPAALEETVHLSKREVDALAREFFRQAKADLDDRSSPAELTRAEREEVEDDLGTQLATLYSWRHPDTHLWVQQAQARALARGELSRPIDPVADQRLSELLRRALIQLCTIELARAGGDFHDRITDDFFAQRPELDRELAALPGLAGPRTTLGECLKRFQREHLDLKSVTEKTANKHKSLLAPIEVFFGSDTRLGDIARADCNRFRDTMAQLPPNFSKRGGGRQSLAAIAEANRGGTLAWETQNNYLRMLAELMGWAVRERLVRDNVAEKIAPLRKRQAAEEQRLPFDKAELEAIFSAPLYTGCVNDERGFARVGPNRPRRSRYWLPLVALFTGMRMGEILQLTPAHVRRSAKGTDFIVLTRDMELKTDNAEREVPVHPELKRLGFLTWVEKRQRTALLFDDVPISKFGYGSDLFTKRFATFLRRVELPVHRRPRLTFHSFRHTFKDALNETGAPEEIKDEICGWSRAKKTGRRYGTGLSADQLKSHIDRLSFGLDLSNLHVSGRPGSED